jgi:hypothetical protein
MILLLFPWQAIAASSEWVAITRNNIGQFTVLERKGPVLACYQSQQLGVLSKASLTVGVRWTKFNQTSHDKKLNLLEKKLKRKPRSPSARAIKSEIKSLQKLSKSIKKHQSNCRSSDTPLPPGQEFSGNAQSLVPYHEQLSEKEVSHILNKVAFGGDQRLRLIGINSGLSALVDALVDGVMSDQERQAFETEADRWADKGSWYESDDLPGKRVWTTEALQAGQMYRLVYSAEPFKEWMTLALSAHFAINLNRIGFSYNTYSHQGLPAYVNLIRANALGSFADLAHGMLSNNAMNEWLDNRNNRVGEPNQNFARELLELFLLGEVDPVTQLHNYYEDSIAAATAYVSGYWEDTEIDSFYGNQVMRIRYDEKLHDDAAMAVFSGISELAITRTFTPTDFISYILYNHPGSARYIAERLAGQMLYPDLGEELVADLAQQLKSTGYALKPFLKKILKSSAFFSSASQGSCVTSPIEHFVHLARRVFPQAAPVSDSEKEKKFYYLLTTTVEAAASSGQKLFEPPSVFAWKGACNINRAGEVARGEGWISMQRVLGRMKGCGDVMNNLNWLEHDYVSRLNLNSRMGAYEIIESVRSSLGLRTLSDAEKEIISRFLVTELNDDGKRSVTDIDLSEDWYVKRKLPRLICLMSEFSSTQVR